MPTADDLDPIQDSKRFYESLMTDADTAPAVPVALPPIPTERLDETEAFRSANRKAQRLHMAFDLFRSLVSGCWKEAIGPGNSTGKIRSWCWDQADAFIGEGDKPTPTTAGAVKAATVETQQPPAGNQNKYLEWLAAPHRGGSCGVFETPPSMTPDLAEVVRRTLLSRGLITATHTQSGKSLVTTGYTLTAAGWHRVAPSDDDDTVDYTPPSEHEHEHGHESQQPAERAA
jgi:hypothetical protein